MIVSVPRAARVVCGERVSPPTDEAKALQTASIATGEAVERGTVRITGNVARVSFPGRSPVVILLNRDTHCG